MQNAEYKLTNGIREELTDTTDCNGLLREARFWAASTDTDVSVIDLSDGETLFTIDHVTGGFK